MPIFLSQTLRKINSTVEGRLLLSQVDRLHGVLTITTTEGYFTTNTRFDSVKSTLNIRFD